MKWEYKVLTFDSRNRKIEENINAAGMEEWELVTNAVVSQYRVIFTFKRPAREQ